MSDALPPTAPAHERERASYLVKRRQDVWFIAFDGQEFGPYNSDREAVLFAIDAAHKLGENGADTQVLRLDEAGRQVRYGPPGLIPIHCQPGPGHSARSPARFRPP
jgi:hypothetical protein